MELEEMKTAWTAMSAQLEKQQKMTDDLIIKMTAVNFRNQLNKIRIPELIGSVLCIAGAIYILVRLHEMDTWYLLLCGIVSALVLVLLAVFSLWGIRRLQSIQLQNKNYKECLQVYAKNKLKFIATQKINYTLSALLMVILLPVASKLIDGKDAFKLQGLWFYYVTIFPFFYWMATWIFKKYRAIANEAENILSELND